MNYFLAVLNIIYLGREELETSCLFDCQQCAHKASNIPTSLQAGKLRRDVTYMGEDVLQRKHYQAEDILKRDVLGGDILCRRHFEQVRFDRKYFVEERFGRRHFVEGRYGRKERKKAYLFIFISSSNILQEQFCGGTFRKETF